MADLTFFPDGSSVAADYVEPAAAAVTAIGEPSPYYVEFGFTYAGSSEKSYVKISRWAVREVVKPFEG